MFTVAHIATAYSGLYKAQVIFSTLQIVSALICIYGIFISYNWKSK